MTETATLPETPAEAPILRTGGKLTLPMHVRALRSRYVRPVVLRIALYLALVLLVALAVDLADCWSDLTGGRITAGEWIGRSMEASFGSGFLPVLMGVFCAAYAVFMLWYLPWRAGRQFASLYPNGADLTYSFYPESFETAVHSDTQDTTLRANYRDISRKIFENRLCFVLSTGNRVTYSFHKTLMTPEEAERVGALLREKCPQRR